MNVSEQSFPMATDQPGITCSKLTIETLEQGVNMFSVNFVKCEICLWLTLNIFHTLF